MNFILQTFAWQYNSFLGASLFHGCEMSVNVKRDKKERLAVNQRSLLLSCTEIKVVFRVFPLLVPHIRR